MLDGSRKQTVWQFGIPVFLLTVLLTVSSITSSRAQEGGFDKVVKVGVKPGRMMYDVENFTVPAGGRVKLTFDNTEGTLQHNLLILAPGDEQSAIKLAQKAWSMQNPIQNDYVPESEQVLFATALLSPGEKETITFTAPEEPGDHPYVCTMPGHAQTMNGMMHVREPGSTGSSKDRPDSVALRDLSYRYYKGKWEKLPPFGDLEPVSSGTLQEGKVTLAVAERKEHYGLVFEAVLQIPSNGRYKFQLASDDGSRLLVNDEVVVDNDGLHGVEIKTGTSRLSAGSHDLRVEYFQAPADAGLELVLITPDGNRVNLSADTGSVAQARKFLIRPRSSARIYRVLLPDTSARSIAVGMPSGVHYCFDPEECVIQYAWAGGFLDVGPERGNGEGRGARSLSNIVGDRFDVGFSEYGQPFRIGSPDGKPEVSFEGYRNEGSVPVMKYTLDGLNVLQQVRAAEGERGIKVDYRFHEVPQEELFYRIDAGSVDVSMSGGEWVNETTIALPDEKRFSITILNPE